MRVRIEAKEPQLIKITDADTGEQIGRVQKATWEASMESMPFGKITLEILSAPSAAAEIDVTGEAELVCAHCKQRLPETK